MVALPQPAEGSDWTIETLRQHFIEVLATRDRIIAESDRRYQERFEAQTKALDTAFLAQNTAMQTALTAAERAVQAALTAAEKAVNKAEIAAEKRFESVNEFRAQLSDQAAGFMPRAEAEQRLAQLSETLNKLEKSTAMSAGRGAGVSASWAMMLGVGGLALTIIGLIIAVLLRA